MTKKIILISVCLICLIGASIWLLGENQPGYELNYYSGGFERDAKFIRWLNNNPIDKKYSKDLRLQGPQTDINIAIGNWIEAYDKELDAVFSDIEKVIKSSAEHNEIDTDIIEDAIDSYNKMKSEYEEYLTSYSRFFYGFKTATVGYGSGLPANAGFRLLNIERTMLFDLAELLYEHTGTFSFATESATYTKE